MPKGSSSPIIVIEIPKEWTKSFGYLRGEIYSFLEKTAGYEFYWLHEKGLKKVKSDYTSLPGIYWQWLDYLCIVPAVHSRLNLGRFLKSIKKRN